MKPIVFQKQKQKQQTIKSILSQNLTKTRKHVLGSSRQENLSFIVLQIDFLDIRRIFENNTRTGTAK